MPSNGAVLPRLPLHSGRVAKLVAASAFAKGGEFLAAMGDYRNIS
ncbi:MAG: hypothetical protein PF442_02755 [Desulfobulbaceae bacterium]|nr:hypothetical protein [Desulfobulbaceae bacterium]